MRYFNLLPSSVFVEGYRRVCIVDVEKSIYCCVPKSFASLAGREYIDLHAAPDADDLMPQLQLLERLHLGFFAENIFQFAPYDEDKIIDTPFHLNSLVVDANSVADAIDRLSHVSLTSRSTLIRIFAPLSPVDVDAIAHFLLRTSRFRAELAFKHDKKTVHNAYEQAMERYNKIIHRAIIFNSETAYTSSSKRVVLLTDDMDCLVCGCVSSKKFVSDLHSVCLSSSHNSCLYRKLSIDREGYIRNCPASPQHFGRVGEVSLAEAMAHPDFSRLWGITKDQVDVCRHCEFRRICPDCRVFTRQPERPTAHPARCTYNPYIARWQGQPGYVPVEQCGTFTPEGFVPDAERIDRVLREQQQLKG